MNGAKYMRPHIRGENIKIYERMDFRIYEELVTNGGLPARIY